MPIFAPDEPIAGADYLGKTFPLHYVGRTEDGTLVRTTGALRLLAVDALEIDFVGANEILRADRFDATEYFGPTHSGQAFVVAPELLLVVLADYGEAFYGGVMGFETSPADMPMAESVTFSAIEGSVMFAEGNVVELPESMGLSTSLGDVDLTVDFGTGAVTGEVFSSDLARVDIVDGAIDGNGIMGGLEFIILIDGLPFEFEANSGDVAGTFFGRDATTLGGTFEGVSGTPADPAIEFVGSFFAVEEDPL